MKFSTAFLTFGLVAVVAAQSKTASESPKETSSYTRAQQKCMEGCSTNLSCIAECFGNPAPTEDMVNATTKCMGDCPQGNGTEEQTAKYASCQQKCIADQFFSKGSGGSAVSSFKGDAGGAEPTGTGSSGGAAASGTGTEAPNASASGNSPSGASTFAISGIAAVLAVVAAAIAL